MPNKGQRMFPLCRLNCGRVSAPTRQICSECLKQGRAPARRKEMLWTRYGMTIEQYDKLHAKQNGNCAICLLPETAKHQNGQVKRLAVDHIHETGEIRGLLCKACNQAIGFLKENPEIAIRAASYVALRGNP